MLLRCRKERVADGIEQDLVDLARFVSERRRKQVDLLIQCRVEERRVIRVDGRDDARFAEPTERMLHQTAKDAQTDIAGGRDLNRNAALGQKLDQLRVLDGLYTVADTLGAEPIDRTADAVWAAELPRVG